MAVADRPRHGYGIIKEIEAASDVPFPSSTGTLYLAIQRLEQEGLICEDPTAGGDADARRRYYRLTDLGRQIAAAEAARQANLLAVARTKRLVGKRQLTKLLGPARAR